MAGSSGVLPFLFDTGFHRDFLTSILLSLQNPEIMKSSLPTSRLTSLILTLLMAITANSQKLNMDEMKGLDPRNIGPAGMSGRVTSIDVVLSDPAIIYLGSAAGGLWKSTNGGDTWFPLFEEERTASIGAVVINQNNPSEIWVGTGEGNPRNSQNSGWGIYRSVDAGKTWKHMGLENTRNIHRIILHRDDPNTIIVGSPGATWGDSPNRGVYKSTDGGKTWRKTLFINNRTGISDLVVDPENPNKLIAGMWEHRRWPWTFKSGGPGSGIYISHDAGDTWVRRTADDGLPKGELGRIGISIAPTDPGRVYAYVESKKNAIYRSDDGGDNWKKVSEKGNIGGRPFYYADIYVDTQNENRIYSLATEVHVSEDGGKTWEVFVPGNVVHTDHHAWWSHPDNNEFLILGHDGGLNITYDRGKKWRFMDNLPLAQFYHVRVDNEFPYHVYGGLQDNGSWRGPSRVWFKGGIRNMYWQRLSVGDGFDMVADPADNRYGWSMSQQGGLFRYDRVSGQLLLTKPVHPDGTTLRFNWNAGIAVDPFDDKVVYYGSQFLLKSSDHGKSWQVISPDLTTNDPEKQKQLQSGGLTYDVTGAENFTTIITVVPSTVQQGLIWVGTDDGRIHVTTDGGGNWNDVTIQQKGLPQGIWVPHIHVSNKNAGEAFAVLDDHRRDNWTPYVYHTRDFGRSWTRIVDGNDVETFVYAFVQDPVESNLYFVGTDNGLYVSIDAGANWTKWTAGFPTVPVMDLVIQEREGDLVLGTFGRAFWILDDLRPLRAMAADKSIMAQPVAVFNPPDAHLMVIGESIGYRQGKVGDALYDGENRPYGALISYYLKDVAEGGNKKENPLDDSVKIEILDSDGELVRTMYKKPQKGVNRTNWTLRRNQVRGPNQAPPKKPAPERPGFYVVPGTYQVKVSYGGSVSTASLVVKGDPRLDITQAQMNAKEEAIRKHLTNVATATEAMDQVRDAMETVKFIKGKLKGHDSDLAKSLMEDTKTVENSLKELRNMVLRPEDVQGIYRDPNLLAYKLGLAGNYLSSPLTELTSNQEIVVKESEEKLKEVVGSINTFFQGTWADYRKKIETEAGDILLGAGVE